MGRPRLLHCALIALAAGCGDEELGLPPTKDAAAIIYGTGGAVASGGARSTDPATFGAIRGKVRYEGPAKRNRRLALSDEYCKSSHPDGLFDETWMVDASGGLGGAVVFIQSVGRATFPTPSEPVVLNQHGCQYVPHVVALQVGQPLLIRNSDPLLHNVHGVPVRNKEFNVAQNGGQEDRVVFTRPETGIRVGCDVHGWMDSFICVTDHPFVAVTAPDGSFELKGVPPGDYVVAVWHEELKQVEQSVALGNKEDKTIEFVLR